MSQNAPITVRDQDRLNGIIDADLANWAISLVNALKPRRPKPVPVPQQWGVIMKSSRSFS